MKTDLQELNEEEEYVRDNSPSNNDKLEEEEDHEQYDNQYDKESNNLGDTQEVIQISIRDQEMDLDDID